MDLPLLDGGERAPKARLAAFSSPWNSAASLFLNRSDDSYELLTEAEFPATIGHLATILRSADSDRFSRGDGCDVEIYGGGLSSANDVAVLNGANRAAVKTSSGEWEVLQFRNAVLVGTGRYRLDGFLRGQAGTDAFIEPETAVGAPFVLLNNALVEVPMDGLTGLDLSYLVGPSHKPHSHFSYQAFTQTNHGVAYRPFRPAHLKIKRQGDDLIVSWVRRSRIDGDVLNVFETPLGEDRELYLFQVFLAGVPVREEHISTPFFNYTKDLQAEDEAIGLIEFAVSQVSDRFGPGPSAKVILHV